MKIQKLLVGYFRLKIRLLSIVSSKKAGDEAFRIFCTPYTRMRYNPIYLKNAEPLIFYFEGMKCSGYHWNKGGNRKILIAHGFRSAAVNFEHFVPKLVNKGYEVIAFDAPAHGLSNGKMLTAVSYKNFIAAVNKKYGPFDSYLAHSFGGLAVSMILAEIQANENIRTVLVAPAANAATLIESFFKEMQITRKPVRDHFYANIKRLSGHDIDWFSLLRCAPYIKGPVLWIHDQHDKITPVDDAKNLQATSPSNFRFIFTEDLGHRRIYRDAGVLTAIINFL
ncbi:MAG: alpha/beta hydrolase [Niabella sp.]